jgi:predicted small lipoprotein YifL
MKNAVVAADAAPTVGTPASGVPGRERSALGSSRRVAHTAALIVALSAAAALLAACGNKGPLRLPGDPPKKDARTGPRPTTPASAPPPPTTPGMTQ